METVAEPKTTQQTTTANKRKIKKVAVLGSGVMGSRIACHFANIGVEVLLLDIVPKELTEKEEAQGLTLEDKSVRNRIVNDALQKALKDNPSPIYDKKLANRIQTGNFTDDMSKIGDADWVLEAIVENEDIKKKVFGDVEEHRKEGAIVSTNTSSIPIHKLLEGRSEDFQKHFLGTHFFNPPRYLRLLEIIPTEKTDPEVVNFLNDYGTTFLGKASVTCKDTTAFIANRIGVFGIMYIFHLMEEMEMTVEEIDALTGPVIGRPKSATFRTCDLVGIDTLVNVANIVYENSPDDEKRDLFKIPDYVNKLVENGWLGDKSGQGFYKKSRDEEGNRVILALDINTMDYKAKQKVKFGSVENAKNADQLEEQIRIVHNGEDKGAEFMRKLTYGSLQYVSNRVPEIADELYKVDDALNAGFGWKLGPFATWDALGVKETVKKMEEYGMQPAQWVYDMLDKGFDSFFKIEDGIKKYYDLETKGYKEVPGQEGFIILENYRNNKPVWQNEGATLHDIGDGVLNLEFHTKMNAIGSEVLEGINKSIEIAENGYNGLVISNEGDNFSVGANVGMMFMLAVEQEFDELEFAVRRFQDSMMRIRYSAVPVVVAPHSMTLGGGCETTMHSDMATPAAETYIGLVEVGTGLIPAGGGTKETVKRVSDSFEEGDIQTNRLQNAFINIATAKVATSAHEGFGIKVLREGRDKVVINQYKKIYEGKKAVLDLADSGYTQPIKRDDILVLGRTGLGGLLAGSYSFNLGNYATDHDRLIADKLAYVMCGGDLSAPTKVSEQYLLDLERETFLSLLGEKKTLERIESVLNTGKPKRN
jgi:3-hydroxyacyl-CoA dehydrogenase